MIVAVSSTQGEAVVRPHEVNNYIRYDIVPLSGSREEAGHRVRSCDGAQVPPSEGPRERGHVEDQA